MNVRILDQPADITALDTAWTRIEHPGHFPMQHFIWMQACASTLTSEGVLSILAIEEGGHTVAIAPLIRRTNKPYLEMLGVADFYEPSDVIFAHKEALVPLANALVDLGVPLVLNRIPSDSPLPNALRKAYRHRGALICRQDNSWPFIQLDSRWVEPEKQLNAGRRSDLRRAHRIAAKMGPISSEVLSPVPTTLIPLLDEAFAVEAASWKGAAKTALACDPRRAAFYRQYARAACEKGILRLSFLRIGKEAAAMQLSVETDGRLWLLKIGYDKRFARASPGILLLRETLRYAAIRGLRSVEFLGTMEPWIQVWTEQKRHCVSLRGYPLGFHGATTLTGDLMKSAWQKFAPGTVN